MAAAILVVAIWGLGLQRFMARIPGPQSTTGTNTDAVVVLTGGSGRLREGLILLSEGRADKLFVSGVYRGVDVDALLRLGQQEPQELQCCIALGYSASNTRENAIETAAWMQKEGYRSLQLVTANYHMQRSLLEFRRHMPAVDITPHPIISDNVDLTQWWQPATLRLLASEYSKYLVALALGPLLPQEPSAVIGAATP